MRIAETSKRGRVCHRLPPAASRNEDVEKRQRRQVMAHSASPAPVRRN